MDTKNEVLRLLSYEEVLQLIEVYNTDKPSSARGLNYLLTQKKILDVKAEQGSDVFKSDRERIDFYTHKKGNLKNGTFIAICGPLQYYLFISSLQESGEEIRDCIFNTNLIAWNLGPHFTSSDEREAFMLLDYIKQNNYELFIEIWSCLVYQQNRDALIVEYDVPEDVFVANLTLEDCTVIDDLWPYRYNGSLEFIQDLVMHNGGIGLYAKDCNTLLCWVIKNEVGSPGMLQTIDQAKRKGYAAIVMKALAKKMASEDGIDIVAVVRASNGASMKLFQNLGYKVIGKSCYIKTESF